MQSYKLLEKIAQEIASQRFPAHADYLQHSGFAQALHADMAEAARDGSLKAFCPRRGVHRTPPAHERVIFAQVADADAWLKAQGYPWRIAQADEVTQAAPAKGEPVSVFAAQESELLRAIHEAGYKPTDLPMRRSGHPGAKAEIRARLKNHRLFVGEKKFDKAWERLRASGGIRDSSSPALG